MGSRHMQFAKQPYNLKARECASLCKLRILIYRTSGKYRTKELPNQILSQYYFLHNNNKIPFGGLVQLLFSI